LIATEEEAVFRESVTYVIQRHKWKSFKDAGRIISLPKQTLVCA